jgi:hypothetical protein
MPLLGPALAGLDFFIARLSRLQLYLKAYRPYYYRPYPFFPFF